MLKRIISILTCVGMLTPCTAGISAYAAEPYSTTSWGEYIDGWYHISTAEQLYQLSEATKNTNHPALSAKIMLDNDIILSGTYDNQINIASSSEAPFRGIFDGNGHTISGLSHSSYTTDSGLFAFTDGAEIKNLVLDNASIQTVHRGGLIVGHAETTNFLNISVRNSNMKIISGGVAIELITADGATLGGIAGEMVENCLMYNCETSDVYINTGEAEGVSALNGDGYYVGGLAGTLDNSHIEYSRTLSSSETDSGIINADLVIAVSALSFKNIYVGGLVGEMKNGATVIDSFSNIALYSDPATGVTVIGAVYGYLGGIVGAIYGNRCELARCHYSGTAYQKDFGGLLIVAPVDNTHRGGIIGKIDDYNNITDGSYQNLYFNYDRVMEATGSGVHYDDECAVAYRDSTAGLYRSVDLDNCGSYSNDAYSDQANSWSNNGYDFDGSVLRDTPCNVFFTENGGLHANQWVMHTYNYTNTSDTEFTTTTMPIHGTTQVTVYTNEYNAFTDENAKSIEYPYTVNTDNTVTLPDENSFTSVDPNMVNDGFIGIAFVSSREDAVGTTVYSCDYIYEPGSNVNADIFKTYANDSHKRICGVWCQAYTMGAQLGLNDTNKGIRVLTAVNTKLLDNIGLTEPDIDYSRGVTFTADSSEYLIKADSNAWIGESYRLYIDKSQLSNVADAKIFSIFLSLNEDEYEKEIEYSGDIIYNATNDDSAVILLDFICGGNGTISAASIASKFISDLSNSGETQENYYGLSQEQFENLNDYLQ